MLYEEYNVTIYCKGKDEDASSFFEEVRMILPLDDILLLKSICIKYNTGGIYAAFGNDRHGLWRAAINAYVRFFETLKNGN